MNTRRTTLERPELAMPTDVAADDYQAAYAQVKASVSPANPTWIVQVHGAIGPVCAQALADRDHGGIVPGTVRDPRYAPPHEVQPVAVYSQSEAAAPDFRVAVAALATEILADNARTWDFYLHMRAVAEARTLRARLEDEERVELQRLIRDQCPVCTRSNSADIGPIAVRSLLPGQTVQWRADLSHTLRSCLACWHEASREHLEALALERIDERGTRRQIIATHLGNAGR